jgi:hypothetical protein
MLAKTHNGFVALKHLDTYWCKQNLKHYENYKF